jgi:hypothetical protein
LVTHGYEDTEAHVNPELLRSVQSIVLHLWGVFARRLAIFTEWNP